MAKERFYPSYLKHYGILGMKWGQHKYTDKNGDLTGKGIKRYYDNKEYNAKSEEEAKTIHAERVKNTRYIRGKSLKGAVIGGASAYAALGVGGIALSTALKKGNNTAMRIGLDMIQNKKILNIAVQSLLIGGVVTGAAIAGKKAIKSVNDKIKSTEKQ